MDERNTHFRAIFGYAVGMSIGILSYVIAVTFMSIPEKNERFVDIAFGFLLNIFGSCASYLIGGSPSNSKKNTESNAPPAKE